MNRLKEHSNLNKEIFEEFIFALESLWKGKPLRETDEDYFDKKAYLARLVDVGLLKKVEYQNQISWSLSEDCRDYFVKSFLDHSEDSVLQFFVVLQL